MRSSKYHDYRPLKVFLFVILVVIGVLIYVKCMKAPLEHVAATEWTTEISATCTSEGLEYIACIECGERLQERVIPMKDHTGDKKIDENIKESTCTVGGSHDEVVYCKDCGYEMSRETVQDAVIDHNPGRPVTENYVDSTHTVPGSYDSVVYCTECGARLTDHKDYEIGVVVPEKGHDYEWTVEYDEENDQFILTGDCACDEEGNHVVLTDKDPGVRVERDTNYAPCCLNRYYVIYTYYGKTVREYVDLPLENHKFYVEVLDGAGGYVDIFDFAHYDEEGAYFDYSEVIIKTNVRIEDSDKWGDDGFRDGYFRCLACEEVDCEACCPDGGYSWRKVRLYSAYHDRSLDEESDN